jgi:hypothetical protein
LQNEKGAFVVLKKRGVINVLVHLYTPFLENRPFAMMQVGIVSLVMIFVSVLWKIPGNMALFNVCVIVAENPWFGHIFPSGEG